MKSPGKKTNRLAPILSAVAFALIAAGASVYVGQDYHPITVWIATPINSLALGAFGYWFGKRENLNEAFGKLPGLIAAIMKRLVPRFTLRTLVVFVTLVCAYFGAWEATKRYGCRQQGSTSPLPLVVVQTDAVEFPARAVDSYRTIVVSRQPYLWLFGPKFKIPVH